MERFHWIDNATYFRVVSSADHFCRVNQVGDQREIMFMRGQADLGPHYAQSFDQAKRWVLRYDDRHEAEITGAPAKPGGRYSDPSSGVLAARASSPPVEVPEFKKRPTRRRY